MGERDRYHPEWRRSGALAVALVAMTCVVGVFPGIAGPYRHKLPDERVARDGDRSFDRVYRIVGKVRLVFFWVSNDNVGGARITWRGDDRRHVASLLIGSEPQRAPRQLNEWGYLREDVVETMTRVFGIRTVTDGASPSEAGRRRLAAVDTAEFGVLCATISPLDTEMRTTTIEAPRDTTYRNVDRVLDVIPGAAAWHQRHASPPADAAPGFLTALESMMRSSAASARRDTDAAPRCPKVSYVYKDAVYDVVATHVERVPQLQTASGLIRNLLRADIDVRDRLMGSTTSFSVTYGAEGVLAGIPVAARYQPNWWFKVELALDEDHDVPSDPAADATLRDRIAATCAPQ